MKKVPSTGDMQKIAVAKKKVRRKIVTEFAKEAANVIVTTSALITASHDHPSLVMVGATVSLVASSASLVSMTSSLDDDDDEYLP
jgi:uncharacterized Tic20 family protein